MSKDFWNNRSANYDNKVKKTYEEAYTQTIELSKKYLNKSDVCLDFACGTGITTMPLSKYVRQIDAIDISAGMIDVAKEKAVSSNVDNINFMVTDIFDNNLKENSYDVVMAFNILYFFEDVDSVVKRIKTLLKPNGIFLSVTDCPGENKSDENVSNSNSSPIFVNELKMSDLNNLITNNGFEILLSKNLFNNPPNYYIASKKLS